MLDIDAIEKRLAEHPRWLAVAHAMEAGKQDQCALIAEVRRLRHKTKIGPLGEIEELESEVKQLRRALGVYADRSNWQQSSWLYENTKSGNFDMFCPKDFDSDTDGAKLAELALSGHDEPGLDEPPRELFNAHRKEPGNEP
jgi:hypothetical protein